MLDVLGTQGTCFGYSACSEGLPSRGLRILVDGVAVACRCCGSEVRICRRCWRGQRYCSDSCRATAKVSSHRHRQRKYARTPAGRESQRWRSQRHRRKKTATDATTPPSDSGVLPPMNHRTGCICCGGKVLHPFVLGAYSPTPSLRRLNLDPRRYPSRDPHPLF